MSGWMKNRYWAGFREHLSPLLFLGFSASLCVFAHSFSSSQLLTLCSLMILGTHYLVMVTQPCSADSSTQVFISNFYSFLCFLVQGQYLSIWSFPVCDFYFLFLEGWRLEEGWLDIRDAATCPLHIKAVIESNVGRKRQTLVIFFKVRFQWKPPIILLSPQ